MLVYLVRFVRSISATNSVSLLFSSSTTSSPATTTTTSSPATTAATASCSTLQPNLMIHCNILLGMRRQGLLVCARGTRRLEGLVKVGDDIVNVFRPDGDADQILGDAGGETFVFGELFVRGGPRVDGEGFGVSDTVSHTTEIKSVSPFCSLREDNIR